MRILCTLAGIARIVWLFGLSSRMTMRLALARRFTDPPRVAAYACRVRRDVARRVCALLRLQVEVAGRIPRRGPVMVVSNHLGYLDIPVISAVLPARFVAKDDVRRWPLIGWLAAHWDTIFVSRSSQNGVLGFVSDLRAALAENAVLVVFPEGTSTDGTEIRPFKTGAFAAVEHSRVPVVPMHVSIREVAGQEPTKAARADVAWFGDATLVGHLLRYAARGSARLRLTFGEPIDARALGRRELAHRAYEAVCALADREAAEVRATPGPEPQRRRLVRALRRAARARPPLFRGRHRPW